MKVTVYKVMLTDPEYPNELPSCVARRHTYDAAQAVVRNRRAYIKATDQSYLYHTEREDDVEIKGILARIAWWLDR